MTNEVLVTRRSEKRKLLDNLSKQPIYHRLVMDLVDMELEDVRRAYEETSPASEFLRGQLTALKEFRKNLEKK